ncbi:MAG: GGDEF domain-containing protein [Treponema sp.]|nr:GGDEF domain-containing protein [Treponema sp.]
MKKKIALLVQDLDSDYFNFMVEGAKSYCNGHGYTLMVFIVRGKNWSHGSFDYQYYAATKLLSKSNVDGILLATNTYCQNAPGAKRQELIKELTFVPLVSIGARIPIASSVVSDSKAAFKELLYHLYDFHQKKNIVLMMPVSSSVDIIMRKQGYEEFLAEKGIPLDDKKIIYADYTFEEARENLKSVCPSKEELYFDAIVTCSDDLAFGCIAYFHEIGVLVPEDVSVTGFDNQRRCLYSTPELTSIDQQIDTQAYLATCLLDKQISKQDSMSQEMTVPSIVKYRESCGCKKEENAKERRNKFDMEELILKRKEVIAHFHFFLQEMQASLSLTDFKKLLVRNLRDYGIKSCVICLYDEPVYFGKNDDFEIPESARVLIAFNSNGYYENLESVKTIPDEKMIPDGFEFEENDEVVVTSLFNTSYQYGYVAYTPGDVESRIYELVFSATGIALASNRLLNLKETDSVTDSLTGVFNRGGFMKYGEKAMRESIAKGETGGVIYGDMDRLKKINDELGHDMGDLAIQAEVKVLKEVLCKCCVIGRLGGDEFAIVSPGLDEEKFKILNQKLEKASENYNNTSGQPFTLSISLGVAFFSKNRCDLQALLKEADEKQYEQKRLHHAQR